MYKIIKIFLSAMIVCLSLPNISAYGEENSGAYAGVTNDIREVLHVKENRSNQCYIAYTTDNLNMRSEPNLEAEILYIIPFNSEILICDYNDNWEMVFCKYHNNDSKNDIAYISKKYISNETCKSVMYNFPTNNGFKSFMPYTAITDISSMQYELQISLAHTGNFGIRQVGDRYCVAVGSAFNVDVGTYIDLILENGNIIQCIVGDIKSPNDTMEDNITTAENGCVSEFIVDINFLESDIKRDGDISSCNVKWDSPVNSLIVYDKNILKQGE